MGNLIHGYSTQIHGENSAATDHAAFSTPDFPLVSWEIMSAMAVVSLTVCDPRAQKVEASVWVIPSVAAPGHH